MRAGNNVIPLPRRRATIDVVRHAIASGKPLPLTVMLSQMWSLLEEAEQIDDPVAARIQKDRAVRLAIEAAPYIHPKQSSVSLGSDPDKPLRVTVFDRMSDVEVDRLLAAADAGANLLELLPDA